MVNITIAILLIAAPFILRLAAGIVFRQYFAEKERFTNRIMRSASQPEGES